MLLKVEVPLRVNVAPVAILIAPVIDLLVARLREPLVPPPIVTVAALIDSF